MFTGETFVNLKVWTAEIEIQIEILLELRI